MSEKSEYKKLNREDIEGLTPEELGRVKAELGIRIIDFGEWFKEERLDKLRDLAEKIAVCTLYALTIILVISLAGGYTELFWLSIVLFIQWTFIFTIIFQYCYLKYKTTGLEHLHSYEKAHDYFGKWKHYYSIKEDEFRIN